MSLWDGISTGVKYVVVYMVLRSLMSSMSGRKTSQRTRSGTKTPALTNLWDAQQPFGLKLYITPHDDLFSGSSGLDNSRWLFWEQPDLQYGFHNNQTRAVNLTVLDNEILSAANANGSIFAHVCAVKPGYSCFTGAENYDLTARTYTRCQLNVHRQKADKPDTHNLLSSPANSPDKAVVSAMIVMLRELHTVGVRFRSRHQVRAALYPTGGRNCPFAC